MFVTGSFLLNLGILETTHKCTTLFSDGSFFTFSMDLPLFLFVLFSPKKESRLILGNLCYFN